MGQYANLKDYFQNEHKQLIQDAISHHLNDEMQLTELVIRSLVCTDDDECFNAEFEIGVSVNAVDVEETDALKFIITVRGNLEKRFKDIHVMSVRNINGDSFPDDNILSQFILPAIPEGEAERIGNDLYNFYSKYGCFENYKLSIPHLVTEGMIHFAPLPDNCLGRVILSESDVEIMRNVQTSYGLKPEVCTIRAVHGIILLNYEKYAKEMGGGLRITVAHELVHTLFHGRFLKVLQLLGEEKVDMHSSTENVALDEAMSDIQKALCIAEWQADVLAMRLAIPSCTLNDTLTIATFNVKNKSKIINRGDRNQACVKEFAEIYGVSCYVAKERMRQLGFDFVDGTIIEFDGKAMPPFIFQINTLKDNETFVINNDNYERLLQENSDFLELITSRIFVYTGYVVCLYDAKYIKPAVNNGQISYELTDYAREHAHECCLKFEYHIKEENQYDIDRLMSFTYLCRLDSPKEYGEADKDGDYSLSNDAEDDITMFFEKLKKEKEVKKVLRDMEDKGIYSLYDTLKYHKEKKKLTYEKIADRSNIEFDTVKAYFKKPGKNNYRRIPLERLMIICNAFNLEEKLALDLLNKAGYSLNEHELKGQYYHYLLTITNAPLEAWNKHLSKAGLKKLN